MLFCFTSERIARKIFVLSVCDNSVWIQSKWYLPKFSWNVLCICAFRLCSDNIDRSSRYIYVHATACNNVRIFLGQPGSQFETFSNLILRSSNKFRACCEIFLQQPLKNLNCKCNIALLLIARQASDVHFSEGNFTRHVIPEIV